MRKYFPEVSGSIPNFLSAVYSEGGKRKEEDLNMIKILLVCNAGMSTSILVQKMDAECKARGVEAI